LNFVRKVFRGGLEAVLWINLALWTIGGGIVGRAFSYRDNYMFLGVIIGIVIGLLVNIVGGGLIATFINIDENLEILRNNTSISNASPINPIVSSGETWVCKKCGERNPIASSSCKGCGGYK
jgi:hypothetical protein